MIHRRSWTFLTVAGVFVAATAAAKAPQTFTVDGQLFQVGSDEPLLDTHAKITAQILSADGQCILYEETHTDVNTRNSRGSFTLRIGSDPGDAKRSGQDSGNTMNEVFQNARAVTGVAAPGGSCPGPHGPVAGTGRRLRLIVTPSATNTADTLTPDMLLDSVPNALVAETLDGATKADFLQVNTTAPADLSQSTLESLFNVTRLPALQALADGTSPLYMGRAANGGASLPSYTGNPSTPTAGSVWYDGVSGQIKYYNGSVQTLGTAGAGITSLSTTADLTADGVAGGSLNAPGALGLANTGVTPGTYVKVTVDAKGRVTGTPALVPSDISTALTYTPVNRAGDTMTGALALPSNGLTVGTSQLTVASGNVGVGTTSPGGKMEISGPDWDKPALIVKHPGYGANAVQIQAPTWDTVALPYYSNLSITPPAATSTTTRTQTAGLALGSNFWTGTTSSPGTALLFNRRTSATQMGYSLIFHMSDLSGGGDRMALTAGGNLGIGTTTPSTRLHVSRGGVTGYTPSLGWLAAPDGQLVQIDSSGSGDDSYTGMYIGGNNAASSAQGIYLGAVTQNSGRAAFVIGQRTGALSYQEQMRLSNTGNFGIGTTSPAYKLDVNGSLNATSIYLNGTALSATGSSGSIGAAGGAVQTITQTSTDAASADRSVLIVRNNGTSTTNEYNILGKNAAGTTTFSLAPNGSITSSGSISAASSLITPIVYGSTASSGSLTLQSTSHMTKGNVLINPDGGNVGIGTASPSSKLHIGSSASGVNAVIGGGFSSLGALYSSQTTVIGNNVKADESTNNQMVNSLTHATYAGSAIAINGQNGIQFHTKSGAATAGATYSSERMRIDSSGNVGIGTVTPTSKLEVAGRFTVSSSDGNAAGWLESSGESGAANKLVIHGSRGVGGIVFQTNSAERARIDASGNVGIGTSSPLARLHVASPSSANLYLDKATGNDYNHLMFLTGGLFRWAAVSSGAEGGSDTGANLIFNRYNDAGTLIDQVLTLHRATGNVGIGVASPAQRLEVNGNIKATQLCLGADCRGTWPSGGTVTSVTAGTGLVTSPGAGITATGSIGIAAGGVGATELATNAVTTAKISDGNVTGAKLETLAGLTAGAYGSATAVPSVTIDTKGRVTAISTNNIVGLLPTAAGISGKFLKSNGTAWSGQDILFSDIKNSSGLSAFDTAACLANQTVKWSSLTDMFQCQDIGSLDATKITTGTLDIARLPTEAKFWQDGGSNKIYYSAGNVGIGTISPTRPLTVSSATTTAPNGLRIENTATTNKYEIWGGTSGNYDGYLKFGVNPADQNSFTMAVMSSGMFMAGGKNISLSGTGMLHSNEAGTNYGLSFNSGGYTSLGSGSYLSLRTGGATERVRVDASGNVGIGTSTPVEKLHVSGALKVTGTSANAMASSGGLDYAAGVTRILGWGPDTSTPAAFSFWQGSSDGSVYRTPFYIDTAGKVGIGTSSPQRPLHITSGGGVSPTILQEQTAAGADLKKRFIATGIGGEMHFGKFTDDMSVATIQMTVNTAGNVGIGTDSPKGLIEVFSSSVAAPPATSGATQSSGLISRFQRAGGSALDMGSNNGPFWIQATHSTDLSVNYSLLLNPNGGSVGIGTTTPGRELHIHASAASGVMLTDGTSGTNAASDGAYLGYSGSTMFVTNRETGPIQFWTSNAEKMRLDSAGNVGIGTTSPGYKLHVNGSVAGVGAYNALSDRKFKKDVAPLDDGLEKILQMRGVSFHWRQDEFPQYDFNKGNDIGFIAQEVEQVFPEAVSTDAQGTKSVAYSKIVAPLVESVKALFRRLTAVEEDTAEIKRLAQDQAREIAALKAAQADKDAEMARIKAENDDIKARLLRLESRLPASTAPSR